MINPAEVNPWEETEVRCTSGTKSTNKQYENSPFIPSPGCDIMQAFHDIIPIGAVCERAQKVMGTLRNFYVCWA